MPKLKSFDDLKRLREKAQQELSIRRHTGTKITVGMGTCGIAAGARTVMAVIMDELGKRNINDVLLTQSGCLGYCDQEPLVEVSNGDAAITYGKVDTNIARKIVSDHIINGQVLEDHVFIKK